MTDAGRAHAIAQAFVDSLDSWFADPTDQPLVQWDATTEFNFGWVYFWNSRRFLETGEVRHALEGNTPFIVDRRDGSIHPLGTGFPLQETIRAYADAWSGTA